MGITPVRWTTITILTYEKSALSNPKQFFLPTITIHSFSARTSILQFTTQALLEHS